MRIFCLKFSVQLIIGMALFLLGMWHRFVFANLYSGLYWYLRLHFYFKIPISITHSFFESFSTFFFFSNLILFQKLKLESTKNCLVMFKLGKT